MPTQHHLDRTLADGRRVEAFVVIDHHLGAGGDRNTRFSHGWLRIDGEGEQPIEASTRVRTDHPHEFSDKQLAETWLSDRLADLGIEKR